MAQISRKPIPVQVERRLWAESAGKCMNPDCRADLFVGDGDIAERAHIVPYFESAENTFENLVLVCPNCHTNFDKNGAFRPDEVKEWKSIRRAEIERIFGKSFCTFDELRREAVPLLERNKSIYENYYLKGKKELWDIFEKEIIANNRKLSIMFAANLSLFQRHNDASYSNRAAVLRFIDHVKEFEATRSEEEKRRSILFPKVINSIFGIRPIKDSLLPSTESLELLIKALDDQDRFVDIALGVDRPSLLMIEDGKEVMVYLDDAPRIRQLYNDAGCFRAAKIRLDSLNFALRYIRQRGIQPIQKSKTNLKEYIVKGKHFLFAYEYCLSRLDLSKLAPLEETVIVNLHSWNGARCISDDARKVAKRMNVTLLDMDEFYSFIRSL